MGLNCVMSTFVGLTETKGRQIMKTHVLTLIAGLLISVTVGAQTFVIDWAVSDTIHGTPDGGVLKRDGTIRNLNGMAKELYFSYDLRDVSFEHSAQLCMNMCWALYPGPGDDPYERLGQILNPTGTIPIYVDITPNNVSATSTIKVSLFDKTDVNDKISFSSTFVFSPTASLREASEMGVSVGPLPASDNVTVRGTALATSESIGLYNAAGNLVRSFGCSGLPLSTLPLSGLSSGTYRLIVTLAGGEMVAAPIVITR